MQPKNSIDKIMGLDNERTSHYIFYDFMGDSFNVENF